ncbi:MAG: endonuclease/exonuclease/phosphatase family protein, partial [Caulobacteraceae bacterium]
AYPYRTVCAPPMRCTTLILSRAAPRAYGGWSSPDSEGRHSAAWARFGDGDGAFAVIGIHNLWPWPAGPQQAQTRRFAGKMAGFDRQSLIVAGDFNSTPWSFALHRQDRLFGLERRTRALFSWPVRPWSRHKLITPLPIVPIDHIYAGRAWKTVSVTVGPKLGSDHLPVVAVLTR